jgi:hypothetical protein
MMSEVEDEGGGRMYHGNFYYVGIMTDRLH